MQPELLGAIYGAGAALLGSAVSGYVHLRAEAKRLKHEKHTFWMREKLDALVSADGIVADLLRDKNAADHDFTETRRKLFETHAKLRLLVEPEVAETFGKMTDAIIRAKEGGKDSKQYFGVADQLRARWRQQTDGLLAP